MIFFLDSVCSCLPYCCVCNNNNNNNSLEIGSDPTTVHLQQQQQQHPTNHHNNVDENQQDWSTGLQNYQLLQQQPGPPAAIPMTSSSTAADFGSFISGPLQQTASTVYGQPLSTCGAVAENVVFQLTEQRPIALQQQDSTVSAIAPSSNCSYHKYSPTTVLDLGSGTIHKSPCGNDNSGWQNFQAASTTNYHLHNQCYQQNCSCNNASSYHQYTTAIKTEVDCSGGNGQDSLDLVYPMATQEVDYYAQISSSSPLVDTVKTHTIGLDDGSMDFIGNGSLPDTSSVVDLMVLDSTKLLTNNNFYMETYCSPEANATAFNEFQLNAADMHWSQSINQ